MLPVSQARNAHSAQGLPGEEKRRGQGAQVHHGDPDHDRPVVAHRPGIVGGQEILVSALHLRFADA